MQPSSADDLTEILNNLRAGDKSAESRLIPLVYGELHAIAARLMRQERRDHTLQATALVNEAYIRLLAERERDWKDRAHFFGVASQVMRHVLIDHARRHMAGKRGAGATLLNVDDALIVDPERLGELLLLEDALNRLEVEDARAQKVVVYRFYGGLSIDEIAEVMGLSARTVKRDWNFGRAWLRAELSTNRHARQR